MGEALTPGAPARDLPDPPSSLSNQANRYPVTIISRAGICLDRQDRLLISEHIYGGDADRIDRYQGGYACMAQEIAMEPGQNRPDTGILQRPEKRLRKSRRRQYPGGGAF